MSLTDYRQKRIFTETPEPKGKINKNGKKLEFVIQKHHASRLHYDFRLELNGVLKSWAVPKGPSLDPSIKRLAMEVEDHPYEYRKFEGQIPKGNYGAGNVIIWDRGWYEPFENTDDPNETLKAGLKKGDLKFTLHGGKLKGSFALVKTPHMAQNAWLLIKHTDKYASEKDVTEQNKSVVSGRSLDEPLSEVSVPKTVIPRNVKPMLATLAGEPFDDPDWLYEIKWDGYRAIGAWDGKHAELYSRNGLDFSDKYPPVFEALRNLKTPAVLDGEVVVLDDEGRSRFELLQNYGRRPEGELAYYVFDVLWLEGYDLTVLPLVDRKDLLKSLLANSDIIRYSDHIAAKGKQFFKNAQKQKLEGIMAKNSRSQYVLGIRTEEWLKIKTHLRQEAIICGFTEPRGSRKYIGALILGVYEQGRLKYVGHAGGGGNAQLLKDLRQTLQKTEVNKSPFNQKIIPNAPVHWVKPKLLAEVSFSEWTKDGLMRQPIFKGLRSDKDPKEAAKEIPMIPKSHLPRKGKFEFTHLDKVFFKEAGYTKGDLVDYYNHIMPYLLPYITGRPHNLLRQPNGYAGKAFYQKDVSDLAPDWVTTESVYSESNAKNISYYVCDSPESILYMVQLGCIEINPWSSTIKKLDRPDWIVLDLDPEDIPFKNVVKVAQAAKAVIDELKIPSIPKTSGKTGIHIFMPTKGAYTYDQAKQFGEILARLVQERLPDITSLERSPSKRQKKVYLDYLQNREGQTLAAPYSVRPTKAASISTPLHWDEVNNKLDPTKFTIKNIHKRLEKEGDLWKPIFKQKVDISKILSLT